MGIFLVPMWENTGPVHAGANGFSGTAISHNGERQGAFALSQSIYHRPTAEARQEKACPEGKLLKKQIPVRTYYADKKPCFFEIDTVHHCGTSDSGEFCLTLTATTDVYSGWVELRPTLNKAHKWVFEALLGIKATLPFPLIGIYSDNGSEFINSALLKWCQDERIQFTRSRAYRKNDNCFVEQKNFTCIRNFVGYYRFSAETERDAFAADILTAAFCKSHDFTLVTHNEKHFENMSGLHYCDWI